MAGERNRDDRSTGVEPENRMLRTTLAVVLGWLVPGLGHAFLGRYRRGVIFACLIFASFGLGLAHDGKLALRDRHTQPFLSTLQVVANIGVGPADLVARWSVYGAPVYSLPASKAAPAYDRRLEILRTRAKAESSIYGTAYLWTAGLMNLLLLFDIWDIGRGRKA
jgi:hypothetical protein